jgi:flagellar protein FliS
VNTALRNRFVNDGTTMLSNERLLLALYARLLTDLDGAAGALGSGQPVTAHDKLVHAQRILEELHLALDLESWPGGEPLAAIYVYAQGLLVRANLTKSLEPVLECRELIEPLAETWTQAHKQHQSNLMVATSTSAAGAFSQGA